MDPNVKIVAVCSTHKLPLGVVRFTAGEPARVEVTACPTCQLEAYQEGKVAGRKEQ